VIVLLDECVDQELAREFVGLEVSHVVKMGWAGTKNGRLLELAERCFDVFVTVDRNIRYQQNISTYDIAVMILKGRSIDIEDLRPLIPKALAAMPSLKPGTVVEIAE
jgi:hypothetical protein